MILGVLREVVDSDVKTANGLKRRGIDYKIVEEATNKIVVLRHRDMGGFVEGMAVVFELRDRKIHVYARKADGHAALFTASPHIDLDSSECMLEVDGKPFRFWQVSRKALEDLFFGF